MHIGDWLARREMLTPEKIALIDTLNQGKEITYREWNRSANQTAHYLRNHLKVSKGDRVAILSMNCREYLDLWFALGKIGGVMQSLNWRLKSVELIPLLLDAAPVALIYGEEFVETINELRPQLPDGIQFVALDANASPEDGSFSERENYPFTPPPEVELDWLDPWVICYTGGTTGIPKGAILTHRAITANSVNTVVSWGLTPSDVAVLDAPLFHTGGLNVFTAPLVHIGGTSILCKSFNADLLYDLLDDGIVSHYFGVPTMFIVLQEHPRWKEADFSKLKLVISGGAPCPMPVFEKFWDRGIDFKTGYGLTEAGPNTFWLPPEDVRRKPGSVGVPLFHVDVKVINESDEECDAEEVGELVIRGPHVCAGYWNDPRATEEAIRPLTGSPGGPSWLRTGDLAHRDEEGYYFIVGRSKDMFISGGENVYPAEVESVMHAHPSVAEATLIGVPHEKWGEVGRAIVVIRDDHQLQDTELIDFVRSRLASYKAPKSVVFVSELPKTGANKIDKALLMQEYGGG